jgi:hypothetical protein
VTALRSTRSSERPIELSLSAFATLAVVLALCARVSPLCCSLARAALFWQMENCRAV